MGRSLYYLDVDNIDNTNTLYENVIQSLYPEALWDVVLTNTKFLRNNILKMIKEFIDHEHVIYIKEFSDKPAMIYDDPTKFDFGVDEISTDFIIVNNALTLASINAANNTIDPKYSLVLEALNTDSVKKEKWDNFLDEIHLYYSDIQTTRGFFTRVSKIVIEDVIQILKKWDNLDDLSTKDMIKQYNSSHGISFNTSTYWQNPLKLISKNYWEKFSFVLTINDYDLYDETNAKYLTYIANQLYDNGYFDEIVIKMNYFYWHDNYQKIVDWASQDLKSTLVSYRFDTLFSNNSKNRYFDDQEASLYGDIQRKNTMEEELKMFEEQLPIFLSKILTNPQTYGVELKGGYFGQEGNIPNLTLNSTEFEAYKDVICKTLSISPFATINDTFTLIFTEPVKKVFICVRGIA